MPWLVLLVLVAVGLTWLTRHPDSELLERAQDWPVVGPLAELFRDTYLPGARPQAESPPQPHPDSSVVWILPDAEDVEARSFVWVQPGDRLHEEPDVASPVVQEVASIRNLYLLDRRGDWYRVRLPRSGAPPTPAWVLLQDYVEPSAEALRQPDPVLPLPATPAQSDRVEAARQGMNNGGRERQCGPYRLYSDVEDEALIDLCGRVTIQLEEIYPQRYGVDPIGPPAEAILLYQDAADYRSFRQQERVPFENNLAHASPASGYVALFRGDRSHVEVLSTLVHELTHLLNRRSLGPALPPWLAEGLADDLGESRIGEDGTLEPGRLGGEQRVEGATIRRRGGVAAALELQQALEKGELPSLPTLVVLDRRGFQHSDRVQLHYALSSFWIRYLLSGFVPELRTGFQIFLRRVAAGEPITQDLLLESLGRDWAGLEAGFRTWLRLQFLTPLNEIPDESG